MPVVKIIELVGESPKSWEDAASNAVIEATKTLEHVVGADVVGFTAKIEDGKIVQYRANVKIAFRVERTD
ncbi:MAG: dodecin family protein [Candidatus Ranarchaeia archaeon]